MEGAIDSVDENGSLPYTMAQYRDILDISYMMSKETKDSLLAQVENALVNVVYPGFLRMYNFIKNVGTFPTICFFF